MFVPEAGLPSCTLGPNPVCVGSLLLTCGKWTLVGLGAIYSLTHSSEACSGDNDNQCDDNNDCEKKRQSLEQGRQALLNWRFAGLTLPERVSQNIEYNEQVRELNLLIAFHNQNCPKYRVKSLSTIPNSGKPD